MDLLNFGINSTKFAKKQMNFKSDATLSQEPSNALFKASENAPIHPSCYTSSSLSHSFTFESDRLKSSMLLKSSKTFHQNLLYQDDVLRLPSCMPF